MIPPLPLIVVSNGYIDIIVGEYPLYKATAISLFRSLSDNFTYFDKEGKVWQSRITSDIYKLTFINRLIANTFYNPTIEIKRTWKQVDVYEIGELKNKIIYCIDEDNDILTQFVERDFLIIKINACKNFDSVIDTLFKYVFKPNEDQINRELTMISY